MRVRTPRADADAVPGRPAGPLPEPPFMVYALWFMVFFILEVYGFVAYGLVLLRAGCRVLGASRAPHEGSQAPVYAYAPPAQTQMAYAQQVCPNPPHRCRANMALKRQPRPDSVLGFLVKVFENNKLFHLRSAAAWNRCGLNDGW